MLQARNEIVALRNRDAGTGTALMEKQAEFDALVQQEQALLKKQKK